MVAAPQEALRNAGAGLPTARGRHVGLTRLALTDFRNYRSLRLEFEPGRDCGPVVVTGPNGAGKTNLLEALSFLSPGRGLRHARLSEVDRRDGDAASGWAVAATLATPLGALRVGTGRDPTGGERRIVRIDGEPARGHAALAERLGILWLTPAMDRLFADGPAGRRRLMDRLVLGLDPAHAARVARYEQAMRERSRLLRDRVDDRAWLVALEEVMAAEGVAIAAARHHAVARLDEECAAADGAFPRARLAVIGTLEAWLDEMPALAAEERFRAALADGRPGDALSRGAASGPHRSDLGVTHADKGVAAETASTGEQKALLVAIVLGQARLQRALRGMAPLLLLDEVAAHLDAIRRAALFEILASLESQAWITGTEAAPFMKLRGIARFLSVRDGTLSETDF
jgi:DNA replication and repair protein RecF